MKKVLLMGITGINNWGEELISDCVEYIVAQNQEIEVKKATFEPKTKGIQKYIYYALLVLSKLNVNASLFQKLLFLAVKVRCNKYYYSQISECDALIFSCGSFKYTTQKLWAYYALAVQIAEKKNIPVMFNGMNIQKFNSKDYRCRLLQKTINSSVVKHFATRDGDIGINRLRIDYGLRKDIICTAVGDPAFFIPENYNVSRKKSDLVGVNLIFGHVFKKYGGNITSDELLRIYIETLHELDKLHIKWELFTNGLYADYKFGKEVLKGYGDPNKSIKTTSSQEDFLDLISSYKMILGARLHSCIAAYSLDIPFVGFYWDEKLLHFSEVSKTEELFIFEKSLDSNVLSQKISNIYNDGYVFDTENRNFWKKESKRNLEEFCYSI